jgi:hypothetical protein
MSPALCYASTDDPPAGRFAAGLSDHGALAFGLAILVKIDDHPVGHPPELVSPRGIRIEPSEMPGVAHGVQQGQPDLSFWVEPLRGNFD